MKKISIYLAAILLSLAGISAKSQTTFGGAAAFDRTVHDFGDIISGQGAVTCGFNVTNVGREPLNILNVISSCGCTDVRWTRESIAPGGSGSIRATYKNEDGALPFDKTLTVYLSCTRQPVILHLRGNVLEKPEPLETLYPVHYGPLGLRGSAIKGPNVEQGQPRSGEITVANLSDKDIRVSFTDVSEGLTLHLRDGEVIKARSTASLSYTVTPSRSRWGRQWYYAAPLVDGIVYKSRGTSAPASSARGAEAVLGGQNPLLSEGCSIIGVSSWTKENFSDMTKEMRQQGPALNFNQSSYPFGRIKAGKMVRFSINYRNTGKAVARIYAADSDSPRLDVRFANVLEPGQEGTLEGVLDTSGLPSGEVLVIITLTTNCPSRPLANLYITGFIK